MTTKSLLSRFTHAFMLTTAMLTTATASATGAIPQLQQVFLKNDGNYLQWKAVFATDYTWDFNADQDRGATLEIFGLNGQAAGESIETRVKIDTSKTVPTVFTSLDYMDAGGKWLKWLDNERLGSVSGKEVTGYISLAALAKAGISLPSDTSKLSFGNYYIYCGNSDACPGTDISGGAFVAPAALGNSWQLVLDMASPRTSMIVKADCIFAWAQRTAPNDFSQGERQAHSTGNYYYQYWNGSKAVLGIDTNTQHLLYAGPLYPNGLLDLGDLTGWAGKVGCQ